MSGPKLSAYELEQLRKAELERIQREISKSQANIIRMQQEALDGYKWCEQQLLQIERQLNLVATSTLSDAEAFSAKKAILSQRQRVLDLKSAWADYRPSLAARSDSLPEVQTEENRLRHLLEYLKGQQAELSDGYSEYLEALRMVADNAKGSLTCSTFSMVEAMQIVAGKISTASDDEAMQLRNDILSRIARLKTHKLATKKMIARLEHSAQIAEQEADIARLKELDSMVVRDIARVLHRIADQYESYQNAYCENLALLTALGETANPAEEIFETPDSIKFRTAQLLSENASLRKHVLERAERDKVEKSIDAAMASLGYRLIGTKGKSAEGSVKLYEFSDGTGIQMTQRADGVVRMKVVGIGRAERSLDRADTEHLVKMQETFCDVYGTIVEAFEKQGVCQISGTERKLPPDVQFAQMIDVLEYDPAFFEKRSAAGGTKNRTSVQKPLHLTTGE